MQIKIGDKIRELRRRDGRRQEDLAGALGVTCQAVSRWEANGGYPDMEMIPAISNYFGITIDELFGYHSDRETKIDAILAKIDAFDLKRDGDDGWVDECLRILREGLAEFPGNERLRKRCGKPAGADTTTGAATMTTVQSVTATTAATGIPIGRKRTKSAVS